MVRDNKALSLARYGIMFATIFVAMMLDRVISLGLPEGISTAACVLLVTLSFCFLQNKWSGGIIACTLFGIASFVKEFIFPSTIATFPVYVWPLIAIVPRVIMGVVAFAVYKVCLVIFDKIKSSYTKQTICITIGALFGLMTNTLCFLSALNICKQIAKIDYTPIITVIKLVLVTNILPEYLISMLLCPHIVLGVRKGLKLGIDATNE